MHFKNQKFWNAFIDLCVDTLLYGSNFGNGFENKNDLFDLFNSYKINFYSLKLVYNWLQLDITKQINIIL